MSKERVILAIIAAVGAVSAMAADASAAFLMDVKGAVLVNNQPVTAGLEVVQGDRVRVVEGSARLVYANGAAVHIAGGQTLVVLANPPGEPSPADEATAAADHPEGVFAFGGAVALAGVLSQLPKPASP